MKIKEFKNSHDRFLIIDDKEVYHFGASLKDTEKQSFWYLQRINSLIDLGKKWFAFSKFDREALNLINKLKK